MKHKIRIFLFLLTISFSVLFTSCMGTNTIKSSRTASFYPDIVRYDLTSADIEYLGEMDISVAYRRYLGVFRVFEQINDEEVSNRTRNSISLYGDKNLPVGPLLRRAMYDVHARYPEADFLIPVYVIDEVETLFLGRKVRKSAKIKAYKLNI